MSLGKPLFIRTQDKRQMREGRDVRTQSLVHEELLGSVGKVVGAPNHVAYSHIEIIRNDAEVVSGVPIGPQKDEVLKILVREACGPEYQVVEDCLSAFRHPEAQDAGPAFGSQTAALRAGEIATRSLVFPGASFGFGLRALGLKFLSCTEAPVGMAGPLEVDGNLLIPGETL